MPFISPMLAGGMPKDFSLDGKEYVVEEKYDGHRLVVQTTDYETKAWSRYGLQRALPDHLKKLHWIMEPGIYDGELLVPGKRSYGVTELTNQQDLVFVVFDILWSFSINTMNFEYKERREMLEDCLEKPNTWNSVSEVQLAHSNPLVSLEETALYFTEVLAKGGEGLILKDATSTYWPGKRPKGLWIKMKACRTDVLTILGFVPGLNGPYSKVLLKNEGGKNIQVKVRNNELLLKAAADPASFIGRRLQIEFQERTPDGSYRHPRWDRFEDE